VELYIQSPNTPSWRGVQLSAGTTFPLPLHHGLREGTGSKPSTSWIRAWHLTTVQTRYLESKYGTKGSSVDSFYNSRESVTGKHAFGAGMPHNRWNDELNPWDTALQPVTNELCQVKTSFCVTPSTSI